jgi:tripeptidyl-peptidase-1
MGVAGGIPTSFLTVGNSDTHFETALFDTTTYLKTTANPPTVVTTSYGIQEELLSPQMMQ